MNRTIVLYVLNSLLGSGIFIVPSIILSNGWIGISVMLGVGLLFTCLGYVISKVNVPLPVLLSHAFGPTITSMILWSYWVSSTIGTAVVITELLLYLGLASSPYSLYYKCGIALWFTIINYFGINSDNLSNWCSYGILGVLISIPLVSIYQLGITPHIPLMGSSVTSSIKESFNSVLWLYVGIESGVLISGKKNCTKEIITGILLVIGIYTINVYALSLSKLSGSLTPYTELLGRLFGSGKLLFLVLIAIILFNAINTWVLTGALVIGTKEHNLFPAVFAKKNKYNIPHIGLLMTSALMILVFILMNQSNLLTFITSIVNHSVNSAMGFYTCVLFAIYKYTKEVHVLGLSIIFGLLFSLNNIQVPILMWISGLPVYYLR